jgi:hypothetical protein
LTDGNQTKRRLYQTRIVIRAIGVLVSADQKARER